MEKTKQGHCPQCGGDDIEYLGVPEYYSNETIADYERKELEYEFDCGDCGLRFKEVYQLKYHRTENIT